MPKPPTPRQLNEAEWSGWKADDSVFKHERRFTVLTTKICRLKPKRILDIGCGSGYLTRMIKERMPEVEILGIDFSLQALKRCDQLDQVFCADLERAAYPFRDEKFDLIVCSEVMEHLFRPEHLVEEIDRLLSPDGVGIVTVPNFSFWRFRLQSLVGKVPHVLTHPGHFQVFNQGILEKLLLALPFNIVSLTGIHQSLHFVERFRPNLTCDTLVCEFKKNKEKAGNG